MVLLNHFCIDHQMTSAQSSNSNFSETDFLLEDSVDADNHNSDQLQHVYRCKFNSMKSI
jgi:23S rRNA pseudouridine1911/1915/1917 synthase